MSDGMSGESVIITGDEEVEVSLVRDTPFPLSPRHLADEDGGFFKGCVRAYAFDNT